MKTVKIYLVIAPTMFASVLLGGHAAAQNHAEHHPAAAKADAATAAEFVDGEVRRVDRSAGKLTLRHGEIKHLAMPPMTMVFEVKDRAMLDTLKPGDKVKFRAADDNGKFTVMEIRQAAAAITAMTTRRLHLRREFNCAIRCAA